MDPWKDTNSDSWAADFINDFKDDRMTIGLAYNVSDAEKMFAVRVENEVIATGPTMKDVVWEARKALAKRKVKTLASIDDITPEELGSAMKIAAQYLDGEEFIILCESISNSCSKVLEAVKVATRSGM